MYTDILISFPHNFWLCLLLVIHVLKTQTSRRMSGPWNMSKNHSTKLSAWTQGSSFIQMICPFVWEVRCIKGCIKYNLGQNPKINLRQNLTNHCRSSDLHRPVQPSRPTGLCTNSTLSTYCYLLRCLSRCAPSWGGGTVESHIGFKNYSGIRR